MVTTAPAPVSLQWMVHDDLEDLVKAERASNAVPGDEGWLYPWSLDAEQIMEIAARSKDSPSGCETRAIVAKQTSRCNWTMA